MSTTKSKQRISDFQSHINSHAKEIRKAGQEAWRLVTAKGEVQIIREFLAGKGRGTDYLNRNLTSVLSTSGWVVKFASIFLHQMPYVFGLKSQGSSGPAKAQIACELGDLQTIFLYLDSRKKICQARSVIFQAKLKPHTGAHVIDHPQQRELYDDCSSFEYKSVLPHQVRRLPDGHLRERALQYVFVNENPVRVRTIPSDIGQGAFEDYGEHLLRFFNDSTGLNVLPKPVSTDGWDRIVWDMIEHVAKELASRNLIRSKGLDALLDHFNDFENHDVFSIDTTGGDRLPEGSGGFGLQLIIVWDPEIGGEKLQTAGLVQTMPPKLLEMADHYLKINEPDYKKRVCLKDRAADEMAKFALENKISPCDLADMARDIKHEGLVVAAAAAYVLHPGYDMSHLRNVASSVRRKHVQFKIISALQADLEAGLTTSWSRTKMAEIAELYLHTADSPLSALVLQFQQQLKAATQQESESGTITVDTN